MDNSLKLTENIKDAIESIQPAKMLKLGCTNIKIF